MGKSIAAFIALVSIYSTTTLQAADPSNPKATAEAKALYQYLQDITGKNTLSGQESMFSDGAFPSSRDKYIYNKVSKYPAIYTSDFGDFRTNNLSQRTQVVSNVSKYHKAGSIIALQYHMAQPDKDDGVPFETIRNGGGYSQLSEMLKSGTTLNKTFNTRLDEIAKYFKMMENSGIAVLWRPFHEMNCNCFWWSRNDNFKDLWIYTWNYLTKTKECNNLLWVFGVNYYRQGASGKDGPGFYYPGHQYVDVLGVDVYAGSYDHGFNQHLHDDLLSLGGGKPIAIAENGKMPDIGAIKGSQPKWVYWSTWWGYEDDSDDNLYKKNYGDSYVITQDELPLDKLRPGTAALPGASVDTRTRALQQAVTVTATPQGFSVAAGGPCDRITVFNVNGQQVAAINGAKGIIAYNRVPAGTYLFQMTGGSRRTVEKRTLQH